MRVVLLAWVVGIWWLQQAPELPAGRGYGWAVGIASGVFVVAALWVLRGACMASERRTCGEDAGRMRSGVEEPTAAWTVDNGVRRVHRVALLNGGWGRHAAIAGLAVCTGVGGYAWAAYRADARLSDRLPPALEGRDVTVTGVVAGLPTSTGDGVRFVFHVEAAFIPGASDKSVHVPKSIELVWPQNAPFAGKFGRQGRRRSDAAGSSESNERGEGNVGDPIVATRSGERVIASGSDMPRAGERWRLPVRLKAPRGVANWHGFDAELLAFVKGIRASGYVRTAHGGAAASWERRPRRLQAGPMTGYGFAAWRERLRDDFRAALGESGRYGGVLMALALGERGDIADADWQVFADTGVSHLLAISGLHVSLVTGVFAALVGMLWRRACFRRFSLPLWWPAPKAAAVAGLLVAVAYGAVAGWGVPVRRAVGMVGILVVALLSGRFAAQSYVLAWALAVVVALDPWAVVTPGLWLSFGAVAALVMASRHRNTSMGEVARCEADENTEGVARPVLADGAGDASEVQRSLRPSSSGVRHWAGVLGNRLAQATRAQYAVTIGLVPLTLAWFGAVPLLGPLANAVAIPIMTLVVTPLALLSLLLPVSLAHWTLAVAHTVVGWLAAWLGTLAAVPWAVWRAPVSPVWAQVAAVVGVMLCLMPLSPQVRLTRFRWLRRFGARIAGFALMGPAVFASPTRPAEGEFRVTMLDIGQGNAVVVETATRTLLFDTGPPVGRRSDSGRRVIVPYLRATGVQRLDRMIVSHAHDDHFGGALSVLRAFPATQVFSSLPAGHKVRGAAQAHRTCLAGQHWTWDGVTFRFLHPDTSALREGWRVKHGKGGSLRGPNSVSCVLRVSSRRHSALLAADAEAPQERAMLLRGGAAPASTVRSDILLAPHHGSSTSSTPAFVAAVSPRHVVFQTGYRNKFGHPKAPVMERYRAIGARLWQSVAHGGVRFSTAPDGIEVQAYREQYRRYWHATLPETS
ncbi:DNA internalization-related competence protein ComEC/Rec2 [Pandoraea capi]|nr:DNA internalization-related competence protein ComEC/Rec2 [Pandoraea sp. LA3]MDN4583732.1 DNA internalization-related competence protein ComEC/Rec2 [Pandoraea capi]